MKLTRQKSERPRRKHDFYPTPYGLATEAMIRFRQDEPIFGSYRGRIKVLDAGAANGLWGDALSDVSPEMFYYYGIDIEPKGDTIHKGNFLHTSSVMLGHVFDLIYGNPPYSLMEEFVRYSLTSDLLKFDGRVFFMGRLEFLASQRRYAGLFKEFPLKRVYVLSRRPSFFSVNGSHTVDAQDYAMYLWQKGYEGKTELSWLYWDYDPEKDKVKEIELT